MDPVVVVTPSQFGMELTVSKTVSESPIQTVLPTVSLVASATVHSTGMEPTAF